MTHQKSLSFADEILYEQLDNALNEYTPNKNKIKRIIALFEDEKNEAIQLASDSGFKEGQQVGQYQAADKLYSNATALYMFQDEDSAIARAYLPVKIHDMLKDCEKFLNHNVKIYHNYVRGERYKRLHKKDERE